MKKIFNTLMLSAMTAITFLPSCVDTDETLPYVDPNIQFEQDKDKPAVSHGTIENPVQVSDIQNLATNSDTAYLTGYIVGYVCGTKLETGCVFVPSDTVSQPANILLAEAADINDYSKCTPVQLPAGKIRTALNLKDNKDNFGKQVVVGGTVEKYFGVKALKNTFYAKIDGKEYSSAVQAFDNTSPQPVVTEINEPFSTSNGDFRYVNVVKTEKDDQIWKVSDKGYGMVATAYINKVNLASESWLVSAPVDLTGKTTAYLTFDHACNYFAGENNSGVSEACKVLVSRDSITWDEIEIKTWPKNFTFVNSGVIDLSAYAGESRLRVAFKYTSTAEKAGTWEIKNVKLTVTEPVVVVPVRAAEAAGDGTKENPYNISYLQQNTAPTDYVWVKGVIVGYVTNNKGMYTTEGAIATNVLIADADTVKSDFNSTAVRLSGDIKTLVNIVDNSDNYKKEVLFFAKIGKYFNFNEGLSDVKYAKIGDKEAGIDPTAPAKEKVTSKFESDDNTAKEHELPYEETFASNVGDFSFYTVSRAGELSALWSYDSKYGLKVMSKASSSITAENYEGEGYAISPAIKLTNSANLFLTFSHGGNYFTNKIEEDCSVEISEDYSGNPETATWTKLTVEKWPTDWTYVESKVDLSAYKGKTVHIAFHYKGTKESAGVWEIKPFKVEEDNGTSEPVVLIPEGVTPKTIAQVKQLAENTDNVWVEGYVVGAATADYTNGVFKVSPFGKENAQYDVVIGTDISANNLNDCLYINLDGSLKNNKANLKYSVTGQKKVVFYGKYTNCTKTKNGKSATILGFDPTYAVVYDAEGNGTAYGTKPSN